VKKRILNGFIVLILLAGCTENKGTVDTNALVTEDVKTEYNSVLDYIVDYRVDKDGDNPVLLSERQQELPWQEASANVNEVTAYLLGNLRNPIIVEESKYHRIYRDGDSNYLYMIFDKDENLVASDYFPRWPNIVVTDDKTISISIQAGTGPGTRWSYFYSIEKDVFSDVFYAVFQQKDDRIVYGEYNVIVVRDIFGEDEFLQVFSDFEGISKNTAFPFVEAGFIDNGQKISVTYLNERFEETIAIFDLN
jgi:hypothetical protein